MKKVRQRSEYHRELLKKHIKQDGIGLEIGPMDTPVIQKENISGNIYYMDYEDRDTLVNKNANTPFFCAEDVPYIDFINEPNKKMKECLQGMTFDYIIASHVIEHIPDTIGWIIELCDALKNDGIISLAIPNREYTFDVNRHATQMGEFLQNYLTNAKVPTPSQVYDNLSKAISKDGTRLYSDDEAYRFSIIANEGKYLDIHCTVWDTSNIPYFFEKISEMKFVDIEVVDMIDVPEEGEIVIALRKKTDSINASDIVSISAEERSELEHLRKAYNEAIEVQNEQKEIICTLENELNEIRTKSIFRKIKKRLSIKP